MNGVAIYGGFAGTETLTTQRVAGNSTILSGDIGTIGSIADNCYHVVLSVSDANTTKLDGLTITGGNATGFSPISVETRSIYRDSGGGMYNNHSSPSLVNIIFSTNSTKNEGGGMYNESASPSLTNIVFSANSAQFAGGGMYNNLSSSPTLINITFSTNITTASGTQGAAMANSFGSTPTIKNGIFWGNAKFGDATSFGAADVENSSSTSTLTASYTSFQLANNITNYPTANYPNIGTSNNLFAQDPKFVNVANAVGADNIWQTSDDGLELQNTSPCINVGTATGATTTDIIGAARIGNVDMGAYEYNNTCPSTLTPTGIITTNQKAATSVMTIAGTSGAGTLNIIPNATNVIYQAGNFIKLNPGFVANKTSVFTAKILAGCN